MIMKVEQQDRIEILGVDLLDRHRPLVEELKGLAASLKIGLGWHYLLDLSWIISQLETLVGRPLAELKIMDAGAGTGLIQWYMAGKGVAVTSVDRASRSSLPLHYRARYRVSGLRSQDLLPASRVGRPACSMRSSLLASWPVSSRASRST